MIIIIIIIIVVVMMVIIIIIFMSCKGIWQECTYSQGNEWTVSGIFKKPLSNGKDIIHMYVDVDWDALGKLENKCTVLGMVKI